MELNISYSLFCTLNKEVDFYIEKIYLKAFILYMEQRSRFSTYKLISQCVCFI